MNSPAVFSWRKFLGSSRSTGQRGERLARSYLVSKGFHISAANWRNPADLRDELDLVCRDGEVLVFVEVKARAASALVSGYFSIDKRKQRALRRSCTAYLRGFSIERRPKFFRFDVVEVLIANGGAEDEVRHFENVKLFPSDYLY